MKRLPKQVYTREFRENAVLMVTGGLPVSETARRLAIPVHTLRNWVKKEQAGTLVEVGGKGKTVSEMEAEISRLRRELAEAQMERDILNKAAAYFAKGSLPGTR